MLSSSQAEGQCGWLMEMFWDLPGFDAFLAASLLT
jgi:hypothetical protein